MPPPSFREWLGNRDREAVAAERLATLVARSGAGVSRDDLAEPSGSLPGSWTTCCGR